MNLHCVEVIPRRITLADLEKDDCRFPYGDQEITFCGHPKRKGSSYCGYHHGICWNLPRNPRGRP